MVAVFNKTVCSSAVLFYSSSVTFLCAFLFFPLAHQFSFLSLQQESFKKCSSKLTYLNVGNHFKASNNEPLSPPSRFLTWPNIRPTTCCGRPLDLIPTALLISVFDQNVNQNLDMKNAVNSCHS